MKKTLLFSVCAVCLTTLVPAWAASPFVGGWNVEMTMRNRPMDAKLVIKEADGKMTGVWVTPRGKENLESVAVKDGTLSFSRKLDRQGRSLEIKHVAKIKNGALAGWVVTRQGQVPFNGKKAKNANEVFEGKRGPDRDGRPQRLEGTDGERPPRADGQRPPRGDGQRPPRDGQRPERNGQSGPPDFSQLLSRLDSNNDGKLQKAEAPERMAENFSRLDKDGDGALDSSEFERMQKEGGKRAEGGQRSDGKRGNRYFSQLLSRLDNNNDGKLQKAEAPERMAQMFGRLDKDGDGALDASELEHAQKQRQRHGQSGPRGTHGKGQRGGGHAPTQ
jgi:Ca2+-binding EF-hand superfamily protein